MKRQLSLVLALVMILGSFSSVFAAIPTASTDKAAFLAKEGILKGNLDGDLKLNQDLKRRDALVVLSRLFDVEEEAKAYPAANLPFTDINDEYYEGFVAWAVAEGYAIGKTETIFDYNGPLTTQQFATMLLRALGYEENGTDIFKEAYKIATDLEILKDLNLEEKATVTRGDMAAMTFNALGVVVKGEKMTLAEKLGIEMPKPDKAEKLEAKVLDTENLAEVVVELSNAELVKSKDALLNPDNYRLEKTEAKVQHVHLDGDNLILTLVPYGKVKEQPTFKVLAKGKTFDLTIRNIDNAINKTYKNIVAGDNEIIEVTNVDFMGDYGIKVTTSEPIANPLERNFRIDARTSMVVEQYGRDIILTPYHNRAFDKDAVTLTIDKLEDFAGYTTVKEDHSMKLSTDDALPTVERVYRSGAKLVVEFDRDVYEDSVKAYENRRNLGNVSFSERRVEFYAEKAEKVDTNVVEYTFSRDIPRGVEVVIVDVANHFNKAMDKYVGVPAEYRDDYAPVILSSTANVELSVASDSTFKTATDGFTKLQLDNWKKNNLVNTASMTIVFDKDIKEFETLKAADVKVEDYFTLYELDITRRGEDAAKNVKIKVEEVKKDRIVLSFEDIRLNNSDRDYDYILEVKDLSDMNRNRMERDYRDFQVVPVSSKFNITSLDYKDSTYFNRPGVELTLKFNKYVDVDEASNPRNYYLDGKLSFDEAIVERDGVTVSLIIYDTTVAKLLKDNKVLEISPRVTQLSTTNVVVDRFWDIKNKKAIEDKNQADSGAITYINNADAKTVTGEMNVASDALASALKVKVTENVKVYQYDKFNDMLGAVTPITKVAGEQDITLNASTAKVVTKVDGQTVEESIKVNILDNTDKDVKISLVGSTYTDVISGDNSSYLLPADVKATAAQFTAEAEGLAKDISIQKLGDTVLLTGKTEFGTPFSHKLTLEDGPIDFVGLTATATSSDDTVVTLTFSEAVTVAAGQTVTLDGQTGTVQTVSAANTSVTVTFGAAVTVAGPVTGTFDVVVPANTSNNTKATTFTVQLEATGTSTFGWTATVDAK